MQFGFRAAARSFAFVSLIFLAACSGSSDPAASAGAKALSPMTASVGTAPTRQWVNGVYIDTGANTVPAQVYRLYRAAFGRPADPEGLGFQVGQIEVYGHTLQEVATNFVASAEFKQRYGANVDNQQFVFLLYANVLNRAPDIDGQTFWMTALENGHTRGEVLIGFSESDENKNNTAAAVSAGLTFQAFPASRVYLTDGTFVESNPDGTAAQVYRLYQAAFNRPADAQGLGFHVGSIESLGVSLQQVALNFVASPEGKAAYDALDDTQFVTLLYQNVLHRAPDADGLAFHVNNLKNGLPRWAVLLGFSESQENKNNTAVAISAGIHFIPYPKAPTTPKVDPLAPIPPFGYDQTVALFGILEAGVGGDAGGDGGASGGAGDGAPLKNATVVLFDSAGHSTKGSTDENGQYLLKFSTSTYVAPYVVKVIDSGGNVLASATAEQPATGTFVRINISPLTDKITSDVLDPSIGGTDKTFTGTAIDPSKLAAAKQDVVASIADALSTAGVSAATFDPVKSAYVQNGTGVDAVIESISHARDAATGATELHAKLAPVTYDANGTPVPVVISSSQPLSTSLVATIDSATLTYAKLNNWVSGVNRCLAMSEAASSADPVCSNGENNVIASPNFKHNSRDFEEYLRSIFSEADGGHVQGTKLRNPVILFTGTAANGNYPIAVVELTVNQPRTGPLAGNINQELEYPVTLVFRRDDTLTASLAGNWIPYGSQRNYIDSVQTRYRKSKEMNPLRQGNTVSGIADVYETRMQLTFSQYVYNPATRTYVDSNVRAVRFTGPGLPAAGVVLVRSSSFGASSLAIHNKNGTIPPVGTTVNTTSNSFGLAIVAADGSPVVGTAQWNPAASDISAAAPDWSTLGAYGRYKMEIFLNSNTAGTTPDAVESTTNLAAAQPPAAAMAFPYHDPSPSASLVTAPQPSAQSVLVQWSNNFATGPVSSAQVNANERNPKGATSGFTTVTWDFNPGVYGAFTVNSRPTSQLVTSSSTAFPSLTTAAGDFRAIAVWNTHSRALIQNRLRWDN